MITVNRRIEGGDFGSAGSATRVLKDHLRKAGVPAETLRRAMIASYEAEMNVVIHAQRGALWARMDGGRLDLEVIDEGPGISDIGLAMREGWSTASAEARRMGFGAGMGLPNIRRNSDLFEIDSRVGRGTRVRSTILLSPERQDGNAIPSEAQGAGPAPEIRADRCRACHACLAACPTEALRVRGDGPRMLAARCIGCTECAAACRDRVFGVCGPQAGLREAEGAALVVPRGFLASFAAAPSTVLSALSSLGFAEVRFTEEWEPALRREAGERVRRGEGPSIVPSCPAVVALVEARFPGLVARVAPFASPLEAAASGFPLLKLVAVPACPAQRETLRGESRAGRIALAAPSELAAAVQPLLAGRAAATAVPAAAVPAAAPGAELLPDGMLRVTGMRHVLRALELAEAGALPGVRLLEPFACDGGCVGSPYLGVDPFVAVHRLSRAGLPSAVDGAMQPAAVVLRRACAARAGSRLDPDMATAIGMLGAIDEAARSLPGRDCGSCGAPSCAAFAEDLVVGRAGASDCPHRTRPLGGKIS
jgi:anti-sigma regulatory factor (Ser/Thr protein kinase)/Pyruvate/2-oxoacid:ferredoxin oxidoreductase delta subunit